MFKKLILLIVFAFVVFSCKNDTNNAFKGKWVNIENEEEIIMISRIGKKYTVNINDTEKYSATENNGILKIIVDNDTLDSRINNENLLILNKKSFRKLSEYSNPGAGIY